MSKRLPAVFTHDGYVIMNASNGDFMISPEDYHWVSLCNWSIDHSRRGYVIRNGPKGSIRLHREVLGLVNGDGLEGNHLDHNTRNNTRENLVAATKSQNMHWREKAQSNSNTKVHGVCFEIDQPRNPWSVRLAKDGKCLPQKSFSTLYEALQHRNAQALEAYGDHARLVEMTEDEIFTKEVEIRQRFGLPATFTDNVVPLRRAA